MKAASSHVCEDDEVLEEAVRENRSAARLAQSINMERGRKVNNDFEAEVMEKLVYVAIDESFAEARRNAVKNGSTDPARRKETATVIIANCMHSYDVIRRAALSTQQSSRWMDDTTVNKLKFSDHWIHNFIKRFNFSRQAVTKTDKTNRPSPEEVQKCMVAIQTALKMETLELSEIYNYDETPGVWGLNPKKCYNPIGGGGAHKQGNDERSRVTTNVGISAAGDVLPVSFIIPCSMTSSDQSALQVINNLLANRSFNLDGKWEKFNWERTMVVLKNGKKISIKYKRQYLKHPDGRVVWAQHKAYQDTPGLAMWVDLVMGPARVKSGSKKWALVWDNCASHLVESVREVFKSWSIMLFEFNANMTDIIQPVDIVINGPIKALTKAARAEKLYDYFQIFVSDTKEAELLMAKGTKGIKSVKYAPPAPTMSTYLNLISDVFANHLRTDKLAEGIRRCFISVGLAPYNANGDYLKYVSHANALAKAKSFRGRIGVVNKMELSALDLTSDIFFGVDNENDGQLDAVDGEDEEECTAVGEVSKVSDADEDADNEGLVSGAGEDAAADAAAYGEGVGDNDSVA